MKHPQERRSTGSFPSRTSLIALALLAGCATPEAVTVAPTDQPGAEQLESISFVVVPDEVDDLALINGDRELYLGGSVEDAYDVFGPPEDSYPFNDLPPVFADNFRGTGWTDDRFSFGVVTYTEKDEATNRIVHRDIVVLAMVTRENVDQTAVEDTVAQYTASYGPPNNTVPGDLVAYWFWNKLGRRLMVCTATDSRGARHLTVALGSQQVMTLLDMEPNRARIDAQAAVDRLKAIDGG